MILAKARICEPTRELLQVLDFALLLGTLNQHADLQRACVYHIPIRVCLGGPVDFDATIVSLQQ